MEKNFNKYRFGFNGQEKDDEVFGSTGSMLNFKYRMYDSRIVRFFAIDPLTSKYPYWTPYQFAGLTPIWAMELEGLEQYLPYQEAKKMEAEGRKVAHQGFSKTIATKWDKEGTYDVFYRNVSENSPKSWRNYVAYYKPKLTITHKSRTNGNTKAGRTGRIEVGELTSPFEINIPFKSNTSEFLNEDYTDKALSGIINRLKNSDENVTIIPKANSKNYDNFTDKQKARANKLIQKRGITIKKKLVSMGIDENKISITSGSPSSGTTSTSFKFEKKNK